MGKKIARMLGLAALTAFSLSISVDARADGLISIGLGKACGSARDGRALHGSASQSEGMCVYLSADNPNCKQESCCPEVTSTQTSDRTKWQIFDKSRGICKAYAGTNHITCNTGSKLFYYNSVQNALPSAGGFSVATESGAGLSADPQICLASYNDDVTISHVPCGTGGGGQLLSGQNQLQQAVSGLGPQGGCVQATRPNVADVQRPGD